MAYTVDVIKNDENNLVKNIKMFLYGKSFIGKTKFASTFPDGLFVISTDGNTKSIDKEFARVLIQPTDFIPTSIPGKYQEVSGWLKFKEIVKDISINKGGQFDQFNTIVVDVVSHIYDYCRDYVLTKAGVEHESEIKAQGKSWKLIQSEFDPVLIEMSNWNKNVIFICHEKLDEKGIAFPNTISSVSTRLMSISEITGRLIMKPATPTNPKEVRELSVTSSYKQEGGNRFNVNHDIVEPTYEKLIETIKNSKRI